MNPKDVGECIYCGSKKELSTEHIIPYGLGGEDVLLNASCSDCAQITSEFELEVLRNQVMQLRAEYDLPSRNDSVPEKLPLDILTNQKEEKRVHFSTVEHPTLALFLLYPRPGILGGEYPDEGIYIKGSNTYKIGGPELDDFAEKFDIKEIQFSQTYSKNTFERLLAKIAFGYGVREYGLEDLKQSPLRSTILGKEDDAGKWIGCGQFASKPAEEMHDVSLEKQGDWILASVRLFAKAPTPQYIVVLQEGVSGKQPEISHGSDSKYPDEPTSSGVEISQDIEISSQRE